MRFKHGRVSTAIYSFRDKFFKKYKLTECSSRRLSVVMFGLYNDIDYLFYRKHLKPIIVVWCGSDAKKIRQKSKKQAAKLKIIHSQNAKHIAMGKFVSDSLKIAGVKHTIIPICPTDHSIDVRPRGEYIYHYGTVPIYRPEWIPEIEKRTGLKVIHAKHNSYSKDEIKDVYEKCFIGLRLTDHDGLPNTVVELGLMGRRCVYNGGLPHSIPWKNIDDVCRAISAEYARRHEDNSSIAKDMYNYININNSWLVL